MMLRTLGIDLYVLLEADVMPQAAAVQRSAFLRTCCTMSTVGHTFSICPSQGLLSSTHPQITAHRTVQRGSYHAGHRHRNQSPVANVLYVVHVAASHQFHYRANPDSASIRDSGMDAHGEDASVMPVVGKTFGGVLLVRRSPRHR